MVYPEPRKELRRRPQLFMVGIVPSQPSSTRVLIVAHMTFAVLKENHLGEQGLKNDTAICQSPTSRLQNLLLRMDKIHKNAWQVVYQPVFIRHHPF